MEALSEGRRNIFRLWDYLEREPTMLAVLQEYMNETMQYEIALQTRLEEAERKLREYEERNAGEPDEQPASQSPAFNQEEAELAVLPDSGDEAESWLQEAAWAPLPDDDEDEEMPATPMEVCDEAEPETEIREIVLRSRTIAIPVPATSTVVAAAQPERFSPADLNELPVQFRKELQVPQAEAFTMVRTEGSTTIVCGICRRQFETVKGWRIHAARMHKKDGFCVRCGHNVLMPPNYTAAQKVAAMELHNLDWCPRSSAAVIEERRVKRRRLDLLGREEDSNRLFVPGQ